jgi:hypothetical protein
MPLSKSRSSPHRPGSHHRRAGHIVTGGARDEAEYRQIREELFRLPELKEALPRFVRPCGDLSQLWHFIKTQEKLGSYASRREYIWNAFRPLLAGVGDDAGIEREVFFVKGSDHDEYQLKTGERRRRRFVTSVPKGWPDVPKTISFPGRAESQSRVRD